MRANRPTQTRRCTHTHTRATDAYLDPLDALHVGRHPSSSSLLQVSRYVLRCCWGSHRGHIGLLLLLLVLRAHYVVEPRWLAGGYVADEQLHAFRSVRGPVNAYTNRIDESKSHMNFTALPPTSIERFDQRPL